MTDIVCVPAEIGLVDPGLAKIKTYIAGEVLVTGQPVYVIAATGRAGVADANASGKQQFRGIALNDAQVGFAVDVLQDGEVYGFTVSGLDYDKELFLSDTAGSLGDAAGTVTVSVGRVAALTNKSATKVVRIFTQFSTWVNHVPG